MKKTCERRVFTVALVMYARIGADTECNTPFEIGNRIKGACGSNKALALELWAIYQMLFMLRLQNEADVLNAVYGIYFRPFYKSLSRAEMRNEISYRIRRFAIENYIDERTVYRRLKRARDLFFKICLNLEKRNEA